MATEIATTIKGKGALTRKDKQANREAVKELASKHMEKAISKLSEIISDRNAPASAKVAASTQLLDRVAGKPKLVDEKNTAESEMDRMSEAQLLSMICSNIVSMSQEARNTIAETLLYSQRGISLPDRFVDPDFSETAALRAEAEEERPSTGLPPLGASPRGAALAEPRKPKKEPRR